MPVNLAAEYHLAFNAEMADMQVVYLALEPSFSSVGCFLWVGKKLLILTNSQFLLLLLGCQQLGALHSVVKFNWPLNSSIKFNVLVYIFQCFAGTRNTSCSKASYF